MILKTLVKCGFMAIFLFGHSMGMDDSCKEVKQLVIGCRPWDANVQGFSGLETGLTGFVDFLTEFGPKAPCPQYHPSTGFHHFDVNDDGLYEAGNFSAFAASHPGQFQTIIIDWATWQHVRRDGAWADFGTLLGSGGNLIVPVASMTREIKSDEDKRNIWRCPLISNSKEKAEALKNKLPSLFSEVQIIDVSEEKDMPEGKRFDLLRRPCLEEGRFKEFLSMKPAILVATKQ